MGLQVTYPWPPQLVQECNASVQSMKRTEELIHLSKKIHFEGKVHAHSGRDGHTKGSAHSLLPWGLQASQFITTHLHPFLACALCPAALGLTCPPPCLLHPPRSSH